MPRIRFKENFDFRVKPNVTIAYKAGKEYLVSQSAAAQAIDSGKAVTVKRQKGGK